MGSSHGHRGIPPGSGQGPKILPPHPPCAWSVSSCKVKPIMEKRLAICEVVQRCIRSSSRLSRQKVPLAVSISRWHVRDMTPGHDGMACARGKREGGRGKLGCTGQCSPSSGVQCLAQLTCCDSQQSLSTSCVEPYVSWLQSWICITLAGLKGLPCLGCSMASARQNCTKALSQSHCAAPLGALYHQAAAEAH